MRDVTCANGVELLMEYLEGVLPAGPRLELETHVAGCPRCQAFIASYRETPGLIRNATSTTLPEEAARSLSALLRSLRGRPRET
jgi:anti-sigma factor RsiW